MKKSLKFSYLTIRSIPYTLSVLFCLMFIWLFFYELWLIELEPIFGGAYKIGVVFKNIATAYLVTYFFYFFIQLNETKRRAKLYSPLFTLVLNLLRYGNFYFEKMFNSTGLDIDKFENSMDYFKKILDGMDFEERYYVLYVTPPPHGHNWIETSRLFEEKIHNTIDHIRKYKIDLFPVRLTEILWNFEDCGYFHQLNNAVRHIKHHKPNDLNEIAFGNKINELYENFLELNAFANKELKPYISRSVLEKENVNKNINLIQPLPQE